MSKNIEREQTLGSDEKSLGLYGRRVEFEAVIPDNVWSRDEQFWQMEMALSEEMDRNWGKEWRILVDGWTADKLIERFERVDYVISVPRGGQGVGKRLLDVLEEKQGSAVPNVYSVKRSWNRAVELAGNRQKEMDVSGLYQGEFGMVIRLPVVGEQSAMFIPWEMFDGGMVNDRQVKKLYPTWSNIPMSWGCRDCCGVVVDNVGRRGETGVNVLAGLHAFGARVEGMVVNVGVGTEGVEKIAAEMGQEKGRDGFSRLLLVPVPVMVKRMYGSRYEAMVREPLVCEC